MVRASKFQEGLESFANAVETPEIRTHTPHALINENTILDMLRDAVSHFGVNGILYKGESLLTFLEHETVESFVSPKSKGANFEQSDELIAPHLKKHGKPILHIKDIADLGHPIAANQDGSTPEGAFIACQVHGKNGRSARLLFSLSPNIPELDAECRVTFQHYSEIAFHKISEIVTQRERTIRLTPRESEMVKFIAKGRSNPEIAEITGLSVHTVNGYLRGIYLKTSTKDRVSLSLYALHKGLLL